MRLVKAAEELRDACDALTFEHVPYVYNPLAYAWEPHARYLRKFGGKGPRKGIFVGMNPGPWGMAQTGVPFGDVTKVRDWMGITGKVEQPRDQHPKRPITGFDTKRREPSGSRLYGWAQERFGEAEVFFADFFVLNYCPLLFYDEGAKNLTPPQLRKADTEALYRVCDAHLTKATRILEPDWLIGIGGFAESRIKEIAEREGLDVKVGMVLHPSPANPRANKGWAEQAEAQLKEMGVC